jgi:hypothetical protein
MSVTSSGLGRWFDYFLERSPGLDNFFKEHLDVEGRSVLVVLGRSFDPRTTLGLKMLVNVAGKGRMDVRLLTYQEDEGARNQALIQRTEANSAEVRSLLGGRGSLKEHPVEFYSDGRRVASQRAADTFSSFSEIDPYTDIIVDVSGMPRGVFFPLVARLLHLVDGGRGSSGKDTPNLFVLVADDPSLDAAISQEGIEEFADFLAMFRGAFDQEAFANLPKLWIPILGENRLIQLNRIYDLVKPDEICPVLPSPAKNPRRADDLVREYREFLFSQMGIDPHNLIFTAEQNPFEVYRGLREVVLHYQDALGPLGGCRIALSALSSKLMSLGALLAAYELKKSGLKIAVAHVDCHGYSLGEPILDGELFGLWLAGECYEQ